MNRIKNSIGYCQFQVRKGKKSNFFSLSNDSQRANEYYFLLKTESEISTTPNGGKTVSVFFHALLDNNRQLI